jgi:hypothetical protein
MKTLLPILILALLTSCGDGKADAARKLAEAQAEAEAATVEPYLLDLQAFDLPLVVSLPEKLTPDPDSTYGQAMWNEEFGQLRVKAGDHFGLTITEDEGNILRLKADLDRDMLRKHTVLQESPELLIYRSQFPDEDLVFIHFYRVLKVGDRSFVVEDMAEGRYNEADVARMSEAVQAAQAI